MDLVSLIVYAVIFVTGNMYSYTRITISTPMSNPDPNNAPGSLFPRRSARLRGMEFRTLHRTRHLTFIYTAGKHMHCIFIGTAIVI